MQTLRAVLRFGAAVGLSTVAWGWTLSAAQSQAQRWPQRPVKFIVPLGPGAGGYRRASIVGPAAGALG
jgi:hypothetical protein